MTRKSLKIPINKHVVITKDLPERLQTIARDMRRDEGLGVEYMFMEVGRAMKAMEDTLDERVEDAVIKAFKKLRAKGLM